MSTLIKITLGEPVVIPGDPGDPGHPGCLPEPERTICETVPVICFPPPPPPPPAGYECGGTTTVCTTYPAHPGCDPVPPTPPTEEQIIYDYNLGWNAGGLSVESLYEGYYEFKVPRTAVGAIVGLTRSSVVKGYYDMEFSFHCQDGKYRILEGTTARTGFADYAVDDVFKIERYAGVVKYYRNDVEVYESNADPGPVEDDFRLKASLYSANDYVYDAAIMHLRSASADGAIEFIIEAREGEGGIGVISLAQEKATDYQDQSEVTFPAFDSVAADYGYTYGIEQEIGFSTSGSMSGYTIGEVEFAQFISVATDYRYAYGPLQEVSLYQYAGASGQIEPVFEAAQGYIFGPIQYNGESHMLSVLHGDGQVLPEVQTMASDELYYGEAVSTIASPVVSVGDLGEGWLNSYVEYSVSLNATGTPGAGRVLNKAELTAPSMTLEANFGGQADLTAPGMSLSIGGVFPIVGRLDKETPALSLSATGRTGVIGALQAKTPSFSLEGYFGGQLDSTIPPITLNSDATKWGVGRLDERIPRIKLDAWGHADNDPDYLNGVFEGTVPKMSMGGVARLTALTPSIWLRSTATEVIAETTVGYNVNMKHGAVTEFDYMPFTKVVRWGNDYYGVGTGGVYRIGGEDADGTAITSEASLSSIGDTSMELKRMPELRLRYRSSGDITVTVVPDEGDGYSYTLQAVTGDNLSTRRAKIGRGIRSRSWEVQLTGTAMDIDELEVLFEPLTRRLG